MAERHKRGAAACSTVPARAGRTWVLGFREADPNPPSTSATGAWAEEAAEIGAETGAEGRAGTGTRTGAGTGPGICLNRHYTCQNRHYTC